MGKPCFCSCSCSGADVCGVKELPESNVQGEGPYDFLERLCFGLETDMERKIVGRRPQQLSFRIRLHSNSLSATGIARGEGTKTGSEYRRTNRLGENEVQRSDWPLGGEITTASRSILQGPVRLLRRDGGGPSLFASVCAWSAQHRR